VPIRVNQLGASVEKDFQFPTGKGDIHDMGPSRGGLTDVVLAWVEFDGVGSKTRKRVPGAVLCEAERLECLLFGENDPHLAEVWAKPLAGGAWAVGLFNRDASTQPVKVTWGSLGLRGSLHVRDLCRSPCLNESGHDLL
jgi:hypothetical protein